MSLLPPPSQSTTLSILCADPSVWALITPLDVATLKRDRPYIKTKVVKGASHRMLQEVAYRDVIVEEALNAQSIE